MPGPEGGGGPELGNLRPAYWGGPKPLGSPRSSKPPTSEEAKALFARMESELRGCPSSAAYLLDTNVIPSLMPKQFQS